MSTHEEKSVVVSRDDRIKSGTWQRIRKTNAHKDWAAQRPIDCQHIFMFRKNKKESSQCCSVRTELISPVIHCSFSSGIFTLISRGRL